MTICQRYGDGESSTHWNFECVRSTDLTDVQEDRSDHEVSQEGNGGGKEWGSFLTSDRKAIKNWLRKNNYRLYNTNPLLRFKVIKNWQGPPLAPLPSNIVVCFSPVSSRDHQIPTLSTLNPNTFASVSDDRLHNAVYKARTSQQGWRLGRLKPNITGVSRNLTA